MTNATPTNRAVLVLLLVLPLIAVFPPLGCARGERDRDPDEPRESAAERGATDVTTFNRDVAPIVFERCSECHRPGQSGPFDLLTYRDVKKRAEQIVETISSRRMPPWLPEAGEHAFRGERRLTDEQVRTIWRWAAAGAPEGDPEDLPAPPAWAEGWLLGEPDLIVTLDEAYIVPAEGVDVFRNVVIPVPVEQTRWVEAVEVRPGNKRIVHHAILQIDRTPSSRRLDRADGDPGFDGMDMGHSLPPDGHFIGWTPGKLPTAAVPGMAWRLDRGTDVVLQLHLLPSGKPEEIRPSVGFHFADAPPTIRPSIAGLYIENIEIPPFERQHRREDRFTLPVPVDVIGVYPHAHYLGKSMSAHAELPDGSSVSLIRIDDWDFNWQDDYQYVEPVSLPANSTLVLEWIYDNSEDNIRNPNYPPKTVRSGNQSSDEMGSLALQVLARNDHDRALLAEARARDILDVLPD